MDVSTSDKIKAVTEELTEILLAKNHDYGNSALSLPLLKPSIGTEWAILVRMGDKIARLKTLLNSGGAKVQETIDDTVLDLAGYCVLFLVARRKVDNERADTGK